MSQSVSQSVSQGLGGGRDGEGVCVLGGGGGGGDFHTSLFLESTSSCKVEIF